MAIFRKKIKAPDPISHTTIQHIAFIMDGNGRWAKKRGLTRSMGHREGCKRIKEIAILCQEYGISVMSLFCFSTENWKRPKSEVDYLFRLLKQFFENDIHELNARGVKIMISGDLSKIPEETKKVIDEALHLTKNNQEFILNICLNYGGKDEILRAVKAVIKDVQDDKLTVDSITEEVFERYMDTGILPPVDCMVRTSGEQRISNYMLWSLAYAEFIFVPEHWPDFKEASFLNVLKIYASRQRRFGGIKSESKGK